MSSRTDRQIGADALHQAFLIAEAEAELYVGSDSEYCTITTLGSQGVTRDGRERCQTKFNGKNFA
jgi:hypothetical protein